MNPYAQPEREFMACMWVMVGIIGFELSALGWLWSNA